MQVLFVNSLSVAMLDKQVSKKDVVPIYDLRDLLSLEYVI